jgi:tetratricopeptide (TPR) repeat protein
MAELAPGVDIQTLRSDVLGRALGTALQAAMMAGRRDPELYDVARRLSDRAMLEFESIADRQRQAGYRAQLETDAGCLPEAREYLASAMGLPPDTNLDELAGAARNNPFWVMHFARYWAAVATAKLPEADTLQTAFFRENLDQLSFWNSETHPVHVVCWKSGVALAALGERARARVLLDRAIQLAEKVPDALTIRTIGMGAQVDRLALLLEMGERNALRTASEKIQSTLQAIAGPSAPEALRVYFAPWLQRLEAALAAADGHKLRELAADVPY